MPTLSESEREELLTKMPGLVCIKCGKQLVRNYCKSCDEFYFECGCNRKTGHEGHRTY